MVPAEQWANLLRSRTPKPGNTHRFSISAQELSWKRLSQSFLAIPQQTWKGKLIPRRIKLKSAHLLQCKLTTATKESHMAGTLARILADTLIYCWVRPRLGTPGSLETWGWQNLWEYRPRRFRGKTQALCTVGTWVSLRRSVRLGSNWQVGQESLWEEKWLEWEPATRYHEQEAVMERRDSVTRVESFTWICPQPSNWLAMEIKMGKAIFVMRVAYETLLGNFRANSNAKGRRSFLLSGSHTTT